MLRTLRVFNLAVVEDVEVSFGHGLNILTGETGAGKSLLIGALRLVLGDRADREFVRAGADRCQVDAVFEFRDSRHVDSLLEDCGLPRCEEGQLLIRRVLPAEGGGGRSFVNDRAATLQVLRRIGDRLVDMHGPYDHQSLLRPEYQTDVLDAFGHLETMRGDYTQAYQRWVTIREKWTELRSGECSDVSGQMDLLNAQIREVEEAKLDSLDEEELRQQHAEAANAQEILRLAGRVQTILTEDDVGAIARMIMARRVLSEWAKWLPAADGWRQRVETLTRELQILAQDIRETMERVRYDPDRLHALEERLVLLHRLKRKYGGTVPAVLDFLAKARARLHDLSTRGERLARLEAEMETAYEEVKSAGKTLGHARRSVAKRLERAVNEELKDLGFPQGVLAVACQSAEPGPAGCDRVAFAFSPNPGEPQLSLHAIASSGEISRVMLGLKVVLAAHDRVPVLVFDEIDTNVGGEMGRAIGEKLARVARDHQVICITHLPQVAVQGRHHIRVTKDVGEGRTRTFVEVLSGKRRVEEIARMLGGRDLTSVTLRHAAEMLEKATAQP